MGCGNVCGSPRLLCVVSGGGHHCIRDNEVHSGLCVCRCGLRWDVDCVFIVEGPTEQDAYVASPEQMLCDVADGETVPDYFRALAVIHHEGGPTRYVVTRISRADKEV